MRIRRTSTVTYGGPDTPLLDVEAQPHIFYGKGAVVMYTLREHIGADAVNTAVRRYFEKYSAPGSPRPTSRDLYAELRAVTPDSLHSLLRDLFEEITLWDVRADEARVEPVGDGSYRVTLAIEAKKVRSDSIGNETEVPMTTSSRSASSLPPAKALARASRSTWRGTVSGAASRRSP